jgi:transposase
MSPSALSSNPMECPMPQSNDLSRSLTAFDQDSTLIAVIEMSQSNWLVAGLVPGIERQPLKKLSPDEDELLKLVQRWRNEATQAGREIKRIVVAYEAGRDGFWLARWLRRRGIEAYVIHPSSVAVSREHRRAKTDRLDTELLMRAFLGWLRGEKRHCSMAAIPTIEDEDAKRPSREHEKLVGDRTRLVNRMKAMLARFGIRTFKIIGIGIETADMLVSEILSRGLRDSKAVARYAGLTGAPDESGRRRREKGLAKAGNARVRRGMIQLAWRLLIFQKDSALAQWYRARTADARGATRKTMIVALARKLLIALWRMATTGEIPEGISLRAAT